MTHCEQALAFLSHFCAGDVDALAPLLAGDLRFTGPLFTFDSREAYLESLRASPPDRSGYRILNVTESEDSVAVFYEYEKPDQLLAVAQLFRFKEGQIAEISLVFDTKGFS
jgi:hypothetical protein